MTDKAISPLRRRLIEDMTIRRLSPKTHYQYIRHVKKFADFLGRSADKATAEDVHRYQLWLASIGTSVGTANVSATALRFFFKITLKRHDLAEELISTREPRRLPVVLSPEEVGRLLAATTNIKHRAILSLAYATGLRASEIVSLKLTDIDRDRMLLRVEQGKGKKDRYVILSPILLEILHEWWRVARKKGWSFDIMSTSFYLSRRALRPAANSSMPRWQDRLFIGLARSASDATDFFQIPTGRVVEVGTQVAV